ncbi:amino acid permease [Halobacteria archaeon AArc-dxtr1]|nr:amino acid permease [Halobacteria archaeon AArc-dxtr1]
MPTGLKRDLGLLSTTALAIGAMVGSGIFILPAIAYDAAGPAAVLAFFLAGLLVLPAAISAAEMATAMPEDGGAYIYVERGMGPVLGTVAGIGTWLMLSLKSSLALVGGVPYLVVLAPELADWIVPFAIGLAIFFTTVNIVSAEGSGRMQFLIVGVMLLVMALFVGGGLSTSTFDGGQTAGSFDLTSDGLLAAIGVVFVSYAGVTKVTAVAEEVENPGRNLPLAMVGSLLFTTALYVAVVWVAIGVADLDPGAGFVPEGGEDTAPIAAAADAIFGQLGVIAIVLAALLALASTANAGLLAASRFPFAMARDGLVPPRLEDVSDRFATPVNAIALTGAVMVVLVSVFPVQQIAQFGSAFQILVFILLNIAIVGFREGTIENYNPEFIAPWYPWLQFIGIGGGVLVLSQMGLVPFLGSLLIVVGSLGWYGLYVRPRVDREGAARTGVRQSVSEAALTRTREQFAADRRRDVLVSLTPATTEAARTDLLRIATDLTQLGGGSVTVTSFTERPHRAFTDSGPTVTTSERPDWIETASRAPWATENSDAAPDRRGSKSSDDHSGGHDGSLRTSGDQPIKTAEQPSITYREITSESTPEAIVEYASFEGHDLLVLERRREELHDRFPTGITSYVLRHAPCGVVLVEDRGFDGADEIAVVTTRGAYDPLKLLVADAIAEETGAELTLLQAVPADVTDARRATVEEYHTELTRLLAVPVTSRIIEADDRLAGLARFAETADLVVTGTESRGLGGLLLGRPGDRLVDAVDATAIMVQPADQQRPGLVQQYVLDRLFDG